MRRQLCANDIQDGGWSIISIKLVTVSLCAKFQRVRLKDAKVIGTNVFSSYTLAPFNPDKLSRGAEMCLNAQNTATIFTKIAIFRSFIDRLTNFKLLSYRARRPA
jgi:hypothetical protein